jgi:DNA-binding transcriptional LysR family regulator
MDEGMELRTVRYFLQLCKDLNFTVAASNLYITQQTISKSIGKLEKELGVQLFVRETSGLMLTESGEYFRRTMGSVIENLDKSVSETRQLKDSHRTPIRFGYTYGIAFIMWHLITDFEKKYPQAMIIGEEKTDFQCENGLESGVFDIICITEPQNPTGAIPIYEEPVVLAVAKGGPFDREITPVMITDKVLVDGGDEFNVSAKLRSAFERRGLKLVMKGSSLDKTVFADSIREGKCVNAITQNSVFTTSMGFTIRPLPFDEGEVTWKLCLKIGKRESVPELTQHFARFLSVFFKRYYSEYYNLKPA